MTSRFGPPKKILAVLDDNETQIALRSALRLAQAHDAEVDTLFCIEPPQDIAIIARLAGRSPADLTEEIVSRTRQNALERLAQIAPGQQSVLNVFVGKAYLGIIQHVASYNCDFVVKAAEPLSGARSFLHASNDQHLLRKCPCPIWLQTPSASPEAKRIIAAVDLDDWDAAEPDTLDDLNKLVVQTAYHLAHASASEVTILHAWDAMGENLVWAFSSKGHARDVADQYVQETLRLREAAMQRFLDGMQKQFADAGVTISTKLARGAPEYVIQNQTQQLKADIVVMGTVARRGLSGVIIGNSAENIVNSIECPVVAVKPDGFVSPVLVS